MRNRAKSGKDKFDVDSTDLGALLELIRDVLFPLAQAAGVLGKSDSFEALCRRIDARQLSPLWESTRGPRSAKEQGLMKLELALLLWRLANIDPSTIDPALIASAPAGWMESIPADPTPVSTSVHHCIIETAGFLRALDHVREDTVRRGANGRRLIGAASREKVRKEAQERRGRMSKERAAGEIGGLVSLSPATVRRLLSQIHPGDDWDSPKMDGSVDT